VTGVPTDPVPVGTRVTLTAIPNDGFGFIGWSDGSGLTGNPASLVLTSNHVVQAIFGSKLTTVIKNGTIVRTPDLPLYPFGSSVTVRAIADPGYLFVFWADSVFPA
jgi:hypothetical protein